MKMKWKYFSSRLKLRVGETVSTHDHKPCLHTHTHTRTQARTHEHMRTHTFHQLKLKLQFCILFATSIQIQN